MLYAFRGPATTYPGDPAALPMEHLNPSAILLGKTPADAGPRQLAHRERRARILAETRHLITEGGIDGVTLRELAARSRLSVQTIYNIVGNRTQVVHAAIGQYICASVKRAAHFDHCPNFFMGVADALWQEVAANPAYIRAATRACDGRDPALYRSVRKRSARFLKAMLGRHFRQEADRRGVDLTALSENIVAMAGATALEWANDAIGLEQLRYRLASAYGLSMLAVLPEAEIGKVTHWLSGIRMAGAPHGEPSVFGTAPRFDPEMPLTAKRKEW